MAEFGQRLEQADLAALYADWLTERGMGASH
jgi:hypothetical protein